ncbi:hypothetical protein BKA56DRAFT_598095 [Ilyonectria sp. MPI-CAGE-AT-0026]|nr:hypothetical protein BKA56DRAFT_598095 [Ilyonectria sp. MPI-CAGE-AT-0026]
MDADSVAGTTSPPIEARHGRDNPGLGRNGAGADEAEKTSGRRRACNQCKQQKLRCDLASSEDTTSLEVCSRCNRLGLECKIDDGFRRTRKRRRSVDLENEIRELRKQLEESRHVPAATSRPVPIGSTNTASWAMATGTGALPIISPYGNLAQTDTNRVAPPSIAGTASVSAQESPATGTSTAEHSRIPGLTTRPGVDEPIPRRPVYSALPRPRALGNTALSVEEIDELFNTYLTYYHPFLPLIDETKPPHDYYLLSDLLFWSIISVASRRMRSRPTLLPRLARNVTDLLWTTLRSIPYSLATVQALALLCTWPFPTSSSTADPTFMLVGIMLQIGTQMGLHRALDAQDFAKVPTRLDAREYAEWVRTWEACNVVARSVSVGCGLPLFIQTYDWPLPVAPTESPLEPLVLGASFRYHLRIEQFRLRVSTSLASYAPETGQLASMRERLTLYRLLNSGLAELKAEEHETSAFTTWYLAAARLHLHAFYLFDDAATDGFNDRIITLYLTASSLIELSLEHDAQEIAFFECCPFYCYQVFVCAAFTVLKILMNGFFQSILDVGSGTKLLEAAIAALKKVSVANNDLPARLGDVIGFFCALPDPTVIGGATTDDLRLKQVKSRLSMSVVYDCLWTWRKHFQTEENEAASRDNSHHAEGEILTPNDVQSILGAFNFPIGMTGFLDMDMDINIAS